MLLSAASLTALDREIVLGRDDGWQEASLTQNLIQVKGRWASEDLMLKEAEYSADRDTDLLIHFNRHPLLDSTSRYRVAGEGLLLSRRVAALGGASAGFDGGGGLHLVAQPGALLYQGARLQDFTIEFWLYPALLGDGEQIVLWQGARWRGATVIPQELRCSVQDRRLVWSFENFFTGPFDGPNSIRFQGITPLVPRDWHHHLLRFDSRIGMLEYLVDGIPEAVTYSTDSGRENGSILLPFAGDAGPGDLWVGRRFTGFMDELRISRTFVDSPHLRRYGNAVGVFQSRTFDLGYTGTRLKRIDAVYRTPEDSAIYFYYRMTDRADAEVREVPWIQFEPGRPLDGQQPAGQLASGSRGRYLQVMVELYPDGNRRYSPELSELRLVYQQDLPPAPPTGLYAQAGNGEVELNWNAVNEEDVAGYLVYYGSEPGSYHGTDSDLGASPIDAGKVSRIAITGLRNSSLYYFAVVAYDATDPPHRSQFSREVSARPSGLLP
jgi:hypothetical protein